MNSSHMYSYEDASKWPMNPSTQIVTHDLPETEFYEYSDTWPESYPLEEELAPWSPTLYAESASSGIQEPPWSPSTQTSSTTTHSKSRGNSVSTVGEKNGDDNTTAAKRRRQQQNRSAQRAFRQRRQAAFDQVNAELQLTKQKMATLETEVERLQQELAIMRQDREHSLSAAAAIIKSLQSAKTLLDELKRREDSH